MEVIRKILKWQHLGICILVLLTLGLHASVIMTPKQPAFDEIHYIKDAKWIMQGEMSKRIEHPPLARLIILSEIKVFGDNPFGWRIFSVLFGTIGLVLFYFICLALNMSRGAVFLATFVFSLENLNFLQASVAMLDVYLVTFMLGAFLFYLYRQYILSGIAIGLSTLAKLSGVFAAPVLFIHWVFNGRNRARLKDFFMLMVMAPLSFFVLLPYLDFLTVGHFPNVFNHIKQMLTLSSTLTFAKITKGAVSSRPWNWVLRPEIMWYWYDPQYIGVISFTVWALIIPVVVYMLFRARRRDQASIFALSWFAGTYLPWIPLSIITDRISFIYYFYPTIGAICIGIGLALYELWNVQSPRLNGKLPLITKSLVVAYILGHIAVFVMLSPVFAKWAAVIPIPANP